MSESVVDALGTTSDAFLPLRDVFARAVAAQEVGGVALAVYHHGQPVVDLVAGAYSPNSLQLVYSVSKAVSTVAVAIAVQDGLLDIDAPLSDYWPEFKKPSTAPITLRMVMSHRSGLVAFREPLSWDDLMAGLDREQISRIEPWWEPGTTHGYHAFSFGSLVDGAFRHAVGTSIGEFVQQRISQPLGIDLWIGTPAEQLARTLPTIHRPTRITETENARREAGDVITDTIFAAFNDAEGGMDGTDFLTSSFPAASGVTDARSLAKLMSSTDIETDGVCLIASAVRDDFIAERSYGIDRNLGVVTGFGTGFQLPFPQMAYTGRRAYGHEAAGGSYAFCDPDLGIAVGFTTNVFPHLHGASIAGVALMPAIRHLAERAS